MARPSKSAKPAFFSSLLLEPDLLLGYLGELLDRAATGRDRFRVFGDGRPSFPPCVPPVNCAAPGEVARLSAPSLQAITAISDVPDRRMKIRFFLLASPLVEQRDRPVSIGPAILGIAIQAG
jgi:hypothetical protein